MRSSKTRRKRKGGTAADAARFARKPEFKIRFEDEHAVRPDLLDTFAYQYPGERTEVVISTDEFTAVCPWSGLPDFATITVTYVPDRAVIELRSFKYYLYTYRQVGIFQEHLTQRLLTDLIAACDPLSMRVTTDYRIRGGIHTVTHAEYERPQR